MQRSRPRFDYLLIGGLASSGGIGRTRHGHAAINAVVSVFLMWIVTTVLFKELVAAPDGTTVSARGADTVIVAGPFQFGANGSEPAIHIEHISLDRRPGKRYSITVKNGAADGTARVSSATVVLDGVPVTELGDRTTTYEQTVPLDGTDPITLEVIVEGQPGSFVTLAIVTDPDPTYSVHGPVQLTRLRGSPTQFTDEISLNPTASPPFTLYVTNGSGDGSARISSATIDLNGVPILGPSDFNQQVGLLEVEIDLAEVNTMDVELRGAPGSFLTIELRATDVTPPVLQLSAPPEGLVTSAGQIEVVGTVEDATPIVLTVNGAPVAVDGDGTFAVSTNLPDEGANVIDIVAVDGAGLRTTLKRMITRDTEAPILSLTEPGDQFVTNLETVNVSGTVTDLTHVSLNLNGIQVAVDASGAFAGVVALTEGQNFFTVVATDAAGNSSQVVRTGVKDTAPPVLTVTQPNDGFLTADASLTVSGQASDATAVVVSANEIPLPTDVAGVFGGTVPLSEGANTITVEAIDAAGNTTTVVRIVTSDTEPPQLIVDEPTDGATTDQASIAVNGTVEDLTHVAVSVNGIALMVDVGGAFSGTVPLSEGPNTVTVVARDAVGNETTVSRAVIRSSEPDPPMINSNVDIDLTADAPDLNGSVTTTMDEAGRFLYSGPNPIQAGVNPAVFDRLRTAIVRGRVFDRSGSPIDGVAVTILGHPELGQTVTRSSGAFDMAVNGGGQLTVEYRHPDFLPVQRSLEVRWQSYAVTEDVVLTRLDPSVTTVDFSAPIQVARGSVVSDSDGERQATMLFKQGTTAEMIFPDGSTQILPSISVRATEYTVGPLGPNAMPGTLPPTNQYTYAFEASVDEALAAGAETVRFSEPVSFYVEDILQLKPGDLVPTAFYSRDEGNWIPLSNTTALKILDEFEGRAVITMDSTELALDVETMNAIGITAAEREMLAQLYEPGQVLLRARLEHFSPIDVNTQWFYRTFTDDQAVVKDHTQTSSECTESSSLILCQSQTLGETVPLVGVLSALNYRSDRVPGRVAGKSLSIRITGPDVSPVVTALHLEISVGGRRFVEEFAPEPNLRFDFEWDGLDAYGRPVQGAQPVFVRIGKEQIARMALFAVGPGSEGGGVLCDPPTRPCASPVGLNAPPLWGSIGQSNPQIIREQARGRSIVWQVFQTTVGSFDARSVGLGGWTLNSHHFYDPGARTLYLGSGDRRSVTEISDQISTFFGTGINDDDGGDSIPPTEVTFTRATDVEAAEDGSVYVYADCRLWRVARDSAFFIAGRPSGPDSCTGFFGGPRADGDPARGTEIQYPDADWEVDDAGLIYVTVGNAVWVLESPAVVDQDADSMHLNDRYRRVAGVGGCRLAENCESSGDGGLALNARMTANRIALAEDGTLYIADGFARTVRRVDRNGIITRFAGSGAASSCNRSTRPALDGSFTLFRALEVGPDGSVYVLDALCTQSNGGVSTLLKRIDPNGLMTVVGGGGSSFDENIPALDAESRGWDALAIGPDNSVYVADDRLDVVRRIDPNGRIITVAGNRAEGFAGDGGSALTASLWNPNALDVGPDGALYVSDRNNNRVRRIEPPMPGITRGNFLIASADASEVYEFDRFGRHLRTVHALTGGTLMRFAYDARGQLASMTDGDGNATTVVRDSDGAPTAIVAPFGQQTSLSAGGSGFLRSITNPAGEAFQMDYLGGGLLSEFTDPRGNTSTFAYSTRGHLTRDTDALGGTHTLARSDISFDNTNRTGFTVSKRNALDEERTFSTARGPTQVDGRLLPDAIEQINTQPTGLQSRVIVQEGLTRVVQLADGTSEAISFSADPRFGSTSAFARIATMSLPSGLTATVERSRRVQIEADADAVAGLNSHVDSVVINGRTLINAFDAVTRTLATTTPAGRAIFVTIDSLGRVVAESLPGIETINYTYDPRGRLVETTQANRRWQYTYDINGRLATAVDPLSRTTTFVYDGADRIVSQNLPGGRTVGYSYDVAGNLTGVTPPGRPAHTFTHTPLNLTTSYNPPMVAEGATPTGYEYNLDRQLTRILRPDGDTVQFAYDASGRLQSVVHQQGSLSYSYSPTTGHLTSVTEGSEAMNLAYDGSLLTGVTWTGPVAGSVTATYNDDFHVQDLSLNGNLLASYDYDDDGLLTEAGELDIVRDPMNGRIDSTRLGVVTTAETYDNFGQWSTRTVAVNGNEIYRAEYTRDALGRILELLEVIEGDTTALTYEYDAGGQLGLVETNGVVTATYTYDANGNRLSVARPTGVESGAYDNQDRLLAYAGATYGYMRSGELRFKAEAGDTTFYRYDALGNLLQVVLPDGTDVEYVLDGMNRRVGKRINGILVQRFLYQNQLNPMAVLDSAGNTVSRFVYGARATTPDYIIRSDTAYRIVADHLGSVRMVINTNDGFVAQRIDYDEFGRATFVAGAPNFQPFGFAGGLVDLEVRSLKFGVRDYDPVLGRWLAKDPIGFGARSTNLYAYVGGDPINTRDPAGLQSVIAWPHPDPEDPYADPLIRLGYGLVDEGFEVEPLVEICRICLGFGISMAVPGPPQSPFGGIFDPVLFCSRVIPPRQPFAPQPPPNAWFVFPSLEPIVIRDNLGLPPSGGLAVPWTVRER